MSRKQLMHLQRAAGIFFIAVSVFMVAMAHGATNIIDSDVTPILFTLPWGLWWTFSKKLHIDI